MHIQYPKLLPKNPTSSIVDETGFTNSEKIALQNAWRLVKRGFRSIALDIFLNFFMENETLLNRFRHEDGKFNLQKLNRHPFTILYTYQHIIEVGLNHPRAIHVLLTEMEKFHTKNGIKAKEIGLLSVTVNKHILKKLKEISSPTLEVAFKKITKLILTFFGSGGVHNEY